MGDAYVDIRLKVHFKSDSSRICNDELEDTLALGRLVASQIVDDENQVDSAEVVRVGKLNPLVFEVPEDYFTD